MDLTPTLRGWDVRNRLGEINVPTMIRGRQDTCADAIAATLVNGIRGAREVVLEESSHTPVLEETDPYRCRRLPQALGATRKLVTKQVTTDEPCFQGLFRWAVLGSSQ